MTGTGGAELWAAPDTFTALAATLSSFFVACSVSASTRVLSRAARDDHGCSSISSWNELRFTILPLRLIFTGMVDRSAVLVLSIPPAVSEEAANALEWLDEAPVSVRDAGVELDEEGLAPLAAAVADDAAEVCAACFLSDDDFVDLSVPRPPDDLVPHLPPASRPANSAELLALVWSNALPTPTDLLPTGFRPGFFPETGCEVRLLAGGGDCEIFGGRPRFRPVLGGGAAGGVFGGLPRFRTVGVALAGGGGEFLGGRPGGRPRGRPVGVLTLEGVTDDFGGRPRGRPVPVFGFDGVGAATVRAVDEASSSSTETEAFRFSVAVFLVPLGIGETDFFGVGAGLDALVETLGAATAFCFSSASHDGQNHLFEEGTEVRGGSRQNV